MTSRTILRSLFRAVLRFLACNTFRLDWLYKQGVEFQSLEAMSRGEIAQSLEQFYLTARRPNGIQYKKNTLKSIKHALDHYLRSSLFKKDFSISTHYDFRQVNKVLDNLPEDADQNRFPYFTKETILKLYKTGQLGLTTTDSPGIIIQTVWFYIVTYFFTNIDKRLLRDLKESNLILAKDADGCEYYWLNYKPPERIRGDVTNSRIYARPGSLCCPVATIKKYMEHRNPRNEVLFQHPKRINHAIWYSAMPLGKNRHTDLMKSMCLSAGVDPPLTGRCIRSFVQELLQECDEDINNMFRLEGPPSPITMHEFPCNTDPSHDPPFILSVRRLPSPILSTNVSSVGVIQSNHVNIQPRITMSSKQVTNHVSTMIAGSNNNHTTTQGNNVTTHNGRHKTTKSNHLITNPNGSTAVESYPNDSRIFLPYPNSFSSTINDFAKPKESFNGRQYGTKELSYESSDHYDTGMDTSDEGSPPPQLTVVKPIISAVQSVQQTDPNTNQNHGSAVPSPSIAATVGCLTQMEPAKEEWLESAYYKADLKTRNKMRFQARKSLLSFLEELNEISHGYGTELFYEIVQEDTNMWKSITLPTWK